MDYMPMLAGIGNRMQMSTMSIFQQAKLAIVEHVDLAKDALHVYAGLLIFLGACWLFRWKPTSWKPLALVFLLACVGEILDMRDFLAADDPIKPMRNIKDLWNTMLAPVIVALVAKYTRVFEKS